MRKWEYEVFQIDDREPNNPDDPYDDPLLEYLNHLGDQGWEVVNIDFSVSGKISIVMKRPKRE